MSLAVLGLLLLAQSPSTSTTASALDREDALFGDDEAPVGDAADRGAEDREDSILPDGGERGVLDALAETIGATNDYLDIGGALWLWLQYNALERGAPETFELRSPSFLDLYADARPVERLRAFVQARLLYDFTVNPGSVNRITGAPLERTRVLLDQYWVKFDILRTVFVTAGQERIRWGVGQIWQPTDFINQQRLDPTAPFDLRLGVPVVKLHVPVESLGWNFYAIATLDGADQIQKVGGAARAELVFGPAELGLSAAVRKDAPQRLGADLSFGLWLFDLRVEAAVSRRITTPFFRGDPDFSDGVQVDDRQAVEQYSRRRESTLR